MKLKRLGKREALRRALDNAAGLIDAMDLESFYGIEGRELETDYAQDGIEEILTEAQKTVVARILKMTREPQQ